MYNTYIYYLYIVSIIIYIYLYTTLYKENQQLLYPCVKVGGIIEETPTEKIISKRMNYLFQIERYRKQILFEFEILY